MRSDYVSAYLGDLGRYLPDYKEQQHWKTHNIAIDGELSGSKIARDFHGQWTSGSESPLFSFQTKYQALNKKFNDNIGWPLFLPLDDDDRYNLQGLRIPLLESQPEFDIQVLSLVKVMIDSLNEKQIQSLLPTAQDRIVGSISKIEKWFETAGVQRFQDIIKFLRNLQELRSCGTGHRKGKGYAKISKEFKIEENLTRVTVTEILKGIDKNVFDQFKDNPEDFIIKAGNLINEQKATVIIQRITYNKLDDVYDTTIFTEPSMKGRLEENAILAKKHLYDHILYDSQKEREFAEELDISSKVAVYVKLPRGFYISTPVGKYNPDWAIAFYEGEVKHIYFVAETKGSLSTMDIRDIEKAKIHCAREHFKAISTDNVVYDVVDSYQSLMNIVMK